ncbi:hypothetical protein [Candidatus Hodarchaeum mangrovi]
MKLSVHNTSWGSKYTGSLSKGCKQCISGQKLVVLVSTECSSKCFYCPLSLERKASPFAFANERPITEIDDLIIEMTIMDAKGASMTGGDPLESHSFNQTLNFCKLLRSKSKSFHIHVYTRGKELDEYKLTAIAPYISEIRFHVKNIEKDFRSIELALKAKLDVGIEVPIIPTKGIKYYQKLIKKFEKLIEGKKYFYFINFNELEVSETNYRNLLAHGLKCDPHNQAAVAESFKLGHEIVIWANSNSNVPVHFCALRTKDTVQLSNRLYRIAQSVHLPSDVIIEKGIDRGLLIRGVIESESDNLKEIKETLITEFEVPEEWVHLDSKKHRILTNAGVLEDLKDELLVYFPNLKLGIAEEYPTYDQLQTTYIPL